MNKSVVNSKKKGPKYSVRLCAAANLIAAYLNQFEDVKETFEKVLALQVYGTDGMHLYLDSSHDSWDSAVRSAMSEHWVLDLLHDPWSHWAQTIKEAALNDFERREAVRAMLGVLIQQKDRNRLNDLELRKAAEGTLGWTHWDAMRSEDLGSLGFGSKAELEEWIVKVADELRERGLTGGSAQ